MADVLVKTPDIDVNAKDNVSMANLFLHLYILWNLNYDNFKQCFMNLHIFVYDLNLLYTLDWLTFALQMFHVKN